VNLNHKNKLEKGIIGVAETLPPAEQRRIYNIWKETLTKNHTEAFNCWSKKIEDVMLRHNIFFIWVVVLTAHFKTIPAGGPDQPVQRIWRQTLPEDKPFGRTGSACTANLKTNPAGGPDQPVQRIWRQTLREDPISLYSEFEDKPCTCKPVYVSVSETTLISQQFCSGFSFY